MSWMSNFRVLICPKSVKTVLNRQNPFKPQNPTIPKPTIFTSISSFSTLDQLLFEMKKPGEVSHFVFVRSLASVLPKVNDWDSAIAQLESASSAELTPSTAVQVIQQIKTPHLALKFFRWLENRQDLGRNAVIYSAVIDVLTRNSRDWCRSNVLVAGSLLKDKIMMGLDVTPADMDCVLYRWARVGKTDEALEVFGEMRSRGFVASTRSCNALLQALFDLDCCDLGWDLFYEMIEVGLLILDVGTFNVGMKVLCKKGDLDGAFGIFNLMTEKDCVPDLESFNIMIRGCSEKGEMKLLCDLFKMMISMNVKPDSYTLNLLIKELCKQGRPDCGNFIFNYMRRIGWIDKKFVYTRLVDSLCSYGWWLKALKIFVKMVRKGHHPTLALYSNLMRRLCAGGRINQAFWLKDVVSKKEFLSETENHNVLLEGLSLTGRMDMVSKLLAELRRKRMPLDLKSHNIVLCGHCMTGNLKEVIYWVEEIKENGWILDTELLEPFLTSLSMEGKLVEASNLKTLIQEKCETNDNS